MIVELTPRDVEVIRESLDYAKRAVRDAKDMPYAVRQVKLRDIEGADAKLSEATTQR